MSRTRLVLLASIAALVLATSAYALAAVTGGRPTPLCERSRDAVTRLSGTLPGAVGQAYLVYRDGAFVSSTVRAGHYDFTVATPHSPDSVPARIEYSTSQGRQRSVAVARSSVLDSCLALQAAASVAHQREELEAAIEQLHRRTRNAMTGGRAALDAVIEQLRRRSRNGVTGGRALLYTATEQRTPGGRFRMLVRRWRAAQPQQERSITYYRGKTFESAIPPGGTWSSWSSDRPGAIEHTRGRGILRFEQAAVDRAVSRSGHMRAPTRITVHGRAAYRAELPSGEVVLFYAHTFAPIEVVDYRHGRHKRLVASFVERYLAYEELAPTTANLALLRMAPHPGAHVVQRR